MKVADMLALQAMFSRPEKKEKKNEDIVKAFVKLKKAIKEMDEGEKKKDEKKDEKKKNWWDELSILQKVIILQCTVPFVVAVQLYLLLTPVLFIARMMK